MKILMLLVIFLFLGAFFIISNKDIKINTSEGISSFFKEYNQWADSIMDNGKTVAGYVIKMEWLPEDN
jgi:hypothetical protein